MKDLDLVGGEVVNARQGERAYLPAFEKERWGNGKNGISPQTNSGRANLCQK